MAKATLYYVHDPMCSWCWGYRPTWDMLQQQLQLQLAVQLNVTYLVGGLAPDSSEPMPESMQQMLEQTWQKISQQLGTEFNHDFWRNGKPRRSTYLACRATLVARQYGQEQAMVNAIQHAYYLNARNPSDIDILCDLAASLGINAEQFKLQLSSEQIEQQLQTEIHFARQLPIQGFPSLVLVANNHAYPIKLDYQYWQTSLADIQTVLAKI
ncbi:DsbA family protein [Shewanella inventionis]|uniref:DsbA family protein n=1 Tax=Shewanella inventionis TaxID=1738770 RepID=A0ABQ1IQ45_9GAMM|nr:DsbA family protein [Shewanella inventionis]MCL1156507.1 DsbA family protein [Shewanella inventionis]UAL44201.1 DsbA family protein [Shewanella inventionis]GGB46069.1 DsbA family protein [Shewanella inventionis]